MKPLFTYAFIAAYVLWTLVSCTTVTTTAPDGSVTVTKAPAPGVLPFAGDVLRAYSPRPIDRAK